MCLCSRRPECEARSKHRVAAVRSSKSATTSTRSLLKHSSKAAVKNLYKAVALSYHRRTGCYQYVLVTQARYADYIRTVSTSANSQASAACCCWWWWCFHMLSHELIATMQHVVAGTAARHWSWTLLRHLPCICMFQIVLSRLGRGYS